MIDWEVAIVAGFVSFVVSTLFELKRQQRVLKKEIETLKFELVKLNKALDKGAL